MLKDTQNYSTGIFVSDIRKTFICLTPIQYIIVAYIVEKHATN